MNDDALAPVIAVMLILAIGVTVFAVYNSTYLPGLKQQAEVEHIKEVESGFLKFSSDIDNAIASGKNMAYSGITNQSVDYSETIPLGGGDITLNSIKSGGTVRIQKSTMPIYNITINGYSNSSYMINFSYAPTNNFWIDQGYIWKNGNVSVNQLKEQREIQFTNNDDFPESLIDYHTTPTTIYITMVDFSTKKSSISGNGNSILKLNSTVYNLTKEGSPIGATIQITLPDSPIKEKINKTIEGWQELAWDVNETKWTNKPYNDPPPRIILNKIEMDLSVQ